MLPMTSSGLRLGGQPLPIRGFGHRGGNTRRIFPDTGQRARQRHSENLGNTGYGDLINIFTQLLIIVEFGKLVVVPPSPSYQHGQAQENRQPEFLTAGIGMII